MGKPRANFRPFLRTLKADGWAVDHDGAFAKERCCILKKELPDRTLDLQLWGGGHHRVSHWVRGSMNTYPTDFADLAGMAVAIKRETTRRDNSRFSR